MVKTALIFPGQGSQFQGMGNNDLNKSKFANNIYKSANEILGYDIKNICCNASIDELSNTKYAQPAIFIYSMLSFHSIKNINFNAVAGHSLGEISALVISKSININDALKIIKVRASQMERSGKKNPGKMLALIKPTEEQINKICDIPSIVIANINSKHQIVVSGKESEINNAIQIAKELKVRKVIKLKVSGAFHSPLMADVREDLKKVLDSVNFNDAIVPVYQNMNSKPTIKAESLRNNLLNQVENPVNWVQTINNMDSDNIKLYIEVGPQNILKKLNKRITEINTIHACEL